eukprot:NODE_168_length_16247_cov_0.199591.p4 type:complete len:370 gc:universal NODE_168_length_16247_cov_0.199591:1822-713(-)
MFFLLGIMASVSLNWENLLESEEYGKIISFSSDPELICYSLYKLNKLSTALEASNSISNLNVKYALQAQIYYRMNDFKRAQECYSRTNLSGQEFECNKLLLSLGRSHSNFDETFNSILLECQDGNYGSALKLVDGIDKLNLESEDLISLDLQKGVLFYHLGDYKKAIKLFVELIVNAGSPFYVSPRIKKLVPFVKQWPSVHKSSSIRNIKKMQNSSSVIVPLTINLLASLSCYLSSYFVTLFINKPSNSIVSSCKNISYLFRKCIKSNMSWLKHLSPRYTPYDEAISILKGIESNDYWLYKIESMDIDEIKLLRNELGVKSLSLSNKSSMIENAILYAQIKQGKTVQAKQLDVLHKRDPEEYVDADFNK